MNHQALDHHAAAGVCPNCSATVSGNFCHECGQETTLHPPSIHEFLHEFVGHYVALEGKLWQTMKLLLLRPGQLTLEYMAGRRVRYVEPLRVYLTFSLIFFAVLKFGLPAETAHVGAKREHAAATRQAAGKDQGGHADAATAAAEEGTVGVLQEDKPGEMREGTREMREAVGKVSGHMAEKLEHFTGLPGDEQWRLLRAAFFSYAPYALFLMMPLFALYLKVLYLGSAKRYGEHVLFALHTNAFAFLMMTLLALVPDGFGLVGFALLIWLAIYLPKAMRRVYGGGRWLTAARWIVLVVCHWLSIALALVAAVAFGVLH